jgi:hypothetical protein
MPDWKRVIVGDAFQLPSHELNYYRDLFLVWPFLLFSVTGLVNLFGVGHDHRIGVKLVALSLVTILLARERFVLIGGALGFCAVQSLVSFFLRHDWTGLAVAITTGGFFILLIRSLRGLKASYQWPRGMRIGDLLVALSSLGFGILVIHWIGR